MVGEGAELKSSGTLPRYLAGGKNLLQVEEVCRCFLLFPLHDDRDLSFLLSPSLVFFFPSSLGIVAGLYYLCHVMSYCTGRAPLLDIK